MSSLHSEEPNADSHSPNFRLLLFLAILGASRRGSLKYTLQNLTGCGLTLLNLNWCGFISPQWEARELQTERCPVKEASYPFKY